MHFRVRKEHAHLHRYCSVTAEEAGLYWCTPLSLNEGLRRSPTPVSKVHSVQVYKIILQVLGTVASCRDNGAVITDIYE